MTEASVRRSSVRPRNAFLINHFAKRYVATRHVSVHLCFRFSIFSHLNPAGGFLQSLCASVCPCVCVSVNNIAQKVFKPINFIFHGGLPLDPCRDEVIRFGEKSPRGKGGPGGGGAKFWPKVYKG